MVVEAMHLEHTRLHQGGNPVALAQVSPVDGVVLVALSPFGALLPSTIRDGFVLTGCFAVLMCTGEAVGGSDESSDR